MNMNGWRDRLRSALADRNLSKRKVSIASGNGPGYVHSILDEGKDPGIENLAAVCTAAEISLAFVLYGFEVTPEDESIIAAMHESPEKRAAVLTLIGGKARQPEQ